MNRIKELREELGITMREAAIRLKMPYTTYVNYEKGVREPNSETLIAIAKFFGVSVDYLICNVNEPYFHLDNERILREINSYETEETPTSQSERIITMDDFTYAMYNESKTLTEEKKSMLLKMARFFNDEIEKEKD